MTRREHDDLIIYCRNAANTLQIWAQRTDISPADGQVMRHALETAIKAISDASRQVYLHKRSHSDERHQ